MKRNVIYGSDNPESIAYFLKNIVPSIEVDCIVASRAEDVFGFLNSLDIDVLILNFENNYGVFNRLKSIDKKLTLILVGRNAEQFTQHTEPDEDTFIFHTDAFYRQHFFTQNIRSILSLSQKTITPPTINVEDSQLLANDQNLCRYVLELDKKHKTLQDVKHQIDHLITDADGNTRRNLVSLSNTIKSTSNQNNLWKDFTIYFEKINPQFINGLTTQHPNLTVKDIKYCCYLKMNMSNNDIKNLLNINQDSVRTHKYRLKKKLKLPKEVSIRNYLQRQFERGLNTPTKAAYNQLSILNLR